MSQLKPSDMYFGHMKQRYHVTVEREGQDCDGYITSGVNEYEMSYEELATRIGLAVLYHGHAEVLEPPHEEFNPRITMVFSNRHDEGYSRTIITFKELEPEGVDDANSEG